MGWGQKKYNHMYHSENGSLDNIQRWLAYRNVATWQFVQSLCPGSGESPLIRLRLCCPEENFLSVFLSGPLLCPLPLPHWVHVLESYRWGIYKTFIVYGQFGLGFQIQKLCWHEFLESLEQNSLHNFSKTWSFTSGLTMF